MKNLHSRVGTGALGRGKLLSSQVRYILFFIFSAFTVCSHSSAEDTPRISKIQGNPDLGPLVSPFVFDGDVRDLPTPEPWQPGDPIKEIPQRFFPPPGGAVQVLEGSFISELDPLVERQQNYSRGLIQEFATPILNFDGQDFTGVNPPDTEGDVGLNHYIQMVNASGGARVRIYNKSGTEITTFFLDSLGSGNCSSGLGDPIVLYDRAADRWLMAELPYNGNIICIYISQTGDPVSGGWYHYSYSCPSFPDYPKLSVWPTDTNGGMGSYLMTVNDSYRSVYAFDRGAMLAGTAGSFQRFTVPALSGFGLQALTPADIDGPLSPPTQKQAIFMRHRDTESHGGTATGDLLEMWTMDVDWNTPTNTTLTGPINLDVSDFDSRICGLTSWECIPQPGSSTRLMPLREFIMNRLQYINHGTHESLVGNLVVDVNGSDLAGVRWFELRRQLTDWSTYQEGTYSVDSDHRWLGGIAMDKMSNIALGYSVASSSTYPSIRYTGRRAADPQGMMLSETHLVDGTVSNSHNRWGDYCCMSLDPADDATFWYTNMYNKAPNWSTRIGSFRPSLGAVPDLPRSAFFILIGILSLFFTGNLLSKK